ncbi:MAG: MFS transporter, partial [Anaerolineaceae bacterium]|nr:MFS transporter [Anaerolineaceae bacterium]
MAEGVVIEKGWFKRFAPIWIGQIFSLLGSGLVQFALVWYLTSKTGSAAILTTATFVALLPEVFIGPFAGALVDRWNRRRVMIIADGAIALVTFGLAALFFTGLVQTWHIF